MIFSAHLFAYLLFCIPIAINMSYLSWKRKEGTSAMPQNQITLWHSVIQEWKKKKNQNRNSYPVCSFVCLVLPVRIKDRAIVDPRFSSAIKSDSSTLITLPGELQFTFIVKPHTVSNTAPSFWRKCCFWKVVFCYNSHFLLIKNQTFYGFHNLLSVG